MSRSLSALLFVALAGCGSSLPRPETTVHQQRDFEEVPYPPPAALVELIPEPPREAAVWVDGQWTFQGRFYSWERGNWVIPPARARHAPWRYVFTEDGRILFAPGIWYDAQGRRMEGPEPVAHASTPPNEFTPESLTSR